MIQRLLGASVGALVSLAILWLSTVANPVDRMPWYVAAVVIGAVTSFLWPVVIGSWLGRRARDTHDEAVQREVQRQLAEERSKRTE